MTAPVRQPAAPAATPTSLEELQKLMRRNLGLESQARRFNTLGRLRAQTAAQLPLNT